MQLRDARRIAEEAIARIADPSVLDIAIDDSHTLELETHWVFFYNTQRFIETGSISDALAGNAPIFVSKADGHAETGRTDIPIEDQLRQRSSETGERKSDEPENQDPGWN